MVFTGTKRCYEHIFKYVKYTELIQIIETGVNTLTTPHIEKLQKYMKEHNLTYSLMLQRNSIDNSQIARAIMEIIRLPLTYEIHAIVSTIRDDERNLLTKLMV